jgi:hypothetical protein
MSESTQASNDIDAGARRARGRRIWLVLGVVACVGLGVLMQPEFASAAQSISAFITNDAAHPVPVTGSVSVNNTVPVNGTVNVGNTVPVNGTVNVGNTIPTVTFDTGCNAYWEPGQDFAFCAIAVPSGKRLFVETVSVQGDVPAGQTVLLGEVGVTPDTNYFYLPTHSTGSYSTRSIFVDSEQVHLYGAADYDVQFYCRRDSTDGYGACHLTVAGYLV